MVNIVIKADAQGKVPLSKIPTGVVKKVNNISPDGAGNVTVSAGSSVTYGATAGTATEGNDIRLSDQRTPLDNSVTSAKIVDGTIVNADVNAAAAIAATKIAGLSTVATTGSYTDLLNKPAIGDGKATSMPVVEKTAAYTLTTADKGSLVVLNSTTAATFTLPNDAVDGDIYTVARVGTGALTIAKNAAATNIRTAAGVVTSVVAAGTLSLGFVKSGLFWHMTDENGWVPDASITSAKILDGTITASDIANTTITGSKLANLTVTSTQIADATISGGKIASTTITATQLADGAVTSSKILDGTIVDGDINGSAAIAPTKVAGVAVITTDTRLSDARTPTAHTHDDRYPVVLKAAAGVYPARPAGAVQAVFIGANDPGVAALDGDQWVQI